MNELVIDSNLFSDRYRKYLDRDYRIKGYIIRENSILTEIQVLHGCYMSPVFVSYSRPTPIEVKTYIRMLRYITYQLSPTLVTISGESFVIDNGHILYGDLLIGSYNEGSLSLIVNKNYGIDTIIQKLAVAAMKKGIHVNTFHSSHSPLYHYIRKQRFSPGLLNLSNLVESAFNRVVYGGLE